jgi:hypothetical protein
MSVQLDNAYLNTEHDRREIDCIQDHQNEVKKQIIMLTRLTKLLIEEKLDPEVYIKTTQEYIDKLQNNIEMRTLYLNKIQIESRVNEEDLKTVLENKELIQVRKKIGDVCEDEYEIKLKALNWDINNLKEKQDHQKKEPEDVTGFIQSDTARRTRNDYQSI